MKLFSLLLPAICIFSFISCAQKSNDIVINNISDSLVFEIIDHKAPVIKKGDKGTENNLHGFEGGRVMKLDGKYQLFTAEMVDKPFWVKMKLAHWNSTDGIHWERVSTLYESSGDFTGTDKRASLWSPMPFYNEAEGRWNIFYVSYRSKEGVDSLRCYEGRVWRAVSRIPGRKGYGGPYIKDEIILEPGKDSDPWEGIQGDDSFFVYEANNKFYGFFGTAKANFWGVGLASATTMAGPWKRCSELNPLDAKTPFVENPIVSNLDDGTYIAIFDCGWCDGFGYILSKDGIKWSNAQLVKYEPAIKKWWSTARTPLCLIKEKDGTYTTFYTAYPDSGKGTFENSGFAAMGIIRFRLRNANQK